jgi:NitT/TauT family transport system substrate-binding protein
VWWRFPPGRRLRRNVKQNSRSGRDVLPVGLRDEVQISRVPGAEAPDASFGLLAAQALEAGLLDGFWANALGSETDALIERRPEQVTAAVRGIIRAQQILRTDPTRATTVGQRRFPADAAALIATLVARDLPFYDPVISEHRVNMTNQFAQALGWRDAPLPYEQVVATRFCHLWHESLA